MSLWGGYKYLARRGYLGFCSGMLALMPASPLILITGGAEAHVVPERIICEKNYGTENSREKMPLGLQHYNFGEGAWSTNKSV